MANDSLTNDLMINLGEHDSDEHHDYPAEESDERIQDAQVKKTDDDEETVGFQPGKRILGSLGYHSHQNL